MYFYMKILVSSILLKTRMCDPVLKYYEAIYHLQSYYIER